MQEKLIQSVSHLKHQHLSVMGVRDPEAWLSLEKKLDLKVASQFRDLYAETDGFSNYHYGSQLILWSLRKITEENSIERGSHNKESSFRIGDFLIESDYLISDLSKEDGEVKLLYEDRILSRGVIPFLNDMIHGKFNFM